VSNLDLYKRGRPILGALVVLAASVAILASVVPGSAGIFDFLFGGNNGGQQRYAAPPQVRPNVFPPLFGPPATIIEVTPSIPGGTGQYVAYCVRLCDGRYFPMQRSVVAQSTQICQNLCPASKIKVFSGTDISNATAIDGARYERLENAFAYRDRIVPGCSCNGREPFGTAVMKIEDDPTLLPGDLVATKDGLVRYTGYPRNLFAPIRNPAQPGKRRMSSEFTLPIEYPE
jgi:hypothetical protein